MFPRAKIKLPIADQVLYVTGEVNGFIEKNNYKTITDENPFVNPGIQPKNTIHKVEFAGGLTGNFTSRLSFNAIVRYHKIKDLQLFYNDSVRINQFDVLYDDANVLNLHAELAYKAADRLELSFQFDQYSYKMDLQEKAWHKPNSEFQLIAKYNLRDKLLLTAGLYGRGSYYVRQENSYGFISTKVNGYLDGNLGLEYRYSKILSVFANFNNLGFSRYYRWYNYPSEKLNVLGGITYSF